MKIVVAYWFSTAAPVDRTTVMPKRLRSACTMLTI